MHLSMLSLTVFEISPRRGNLTFSRCLGVGNLTLASMKMSNSPRFVIFEKLAIILLVHT